ncbi:MAG: flagellar biosynthesis protein FliQ [Gammaproteobacteria bacterium]|nr:flagellar biosynthesis protein FliQ [Gammaproteobacteria bacterium]MBT8124356.1 flagellar biosynthesis protein FliQ [Gammaproteobacteria bacterium]NNC68675.1 flagellar biosynthesis protein FliQ [Gammaproteobacteria bacterium]
MTPEATLTLLNNALWITVIVAAPLLISVLVIGVFVGMLQAATQINEMTLSFIPKLIVLFLTLLLAGPWMLKTLTNYATNLIINIPTLLI